MATIGTFKKTGSEYTVSVRCPRSDGVMEYLLDVHH